MSPSQPLRLSSDLARLCMIPINLSCREQHLVLGPFRGIPGLHLLHSSTMSYMESSALFRQMATMTSPILPYHHGYCSRILDSVHSFKAAINFVAKLTRNGKS